MSPAKRKLTRQEIVAAALAIVDARGLGALSARRLAAALGCEAMSLYHHFPSMDAVLDAIVDALLDGQAIEAGVAPPAAAIAAAAQDYLAIADHHPHAFELVATRRWRTPGALAAASSLVDAFVAAGNRPGQALGKARILAAYLNGAGLALAAWRKSSEATLPEVAAALPGISRDTLGLARIRADLDFGLELLVRALTSSE